MDIALPGMEHLVSEHPLPRRMGTMHRAYGRAEGHECGQCIHLLRFRRGTSWMKCDLTRMTGSSSTDWRARWPACGKFEAGTGILQVE